jgi:hypothetical protein
MLLLLLLLLCEETNLKLSTTFNSVPQDLLSSNNMLEDTKKKC